MRETMLSLTILAMMTPAFTGCQKSPTSDAKPQAAKSAAVAPEEQSRVATPVATEPKPAEAAPATPSAEAAPQPESSTEQADRQPEVRISPSEGEVVVGASSAPEGFPLPLMDGMKVMHSAHKTDADEPEMYMVVASATGKVAAVADYYEKVLKDKGMTPERVAMTIGQADQVSLSAKNDQAEISVSVMDQGQGEGAQAVLVWQVAAP